MPLTKTFTGETVVRGEAVGALVQQALNRNDGLLRLVPSWVPRSFLQPGKRLKLAAGDWYAYGEHRGGIDERWLASTTDADNPDRVWHEGQSFCLLDDQLFLLREVIDAEPSQVIGSKLYDKYQRWPVLCKLFDNMGPIPHHMHQSQADAALIGEEGKPEAYYFPPQLNAVKNNFPQTYFGVLPGTTKEQIRHCLEKWHDGDNRILDHSRPYPLEPGTGWNVPTGILHAPGSLCTYEPQWGSDVFAMVQSEVEGRSVPRELLVKSIPKDKHDDLDFIVNQLDWEANLDPQFKKHHHLQPLVDTSRSGPGYTDHWIVYGTFQGEQLFSAKRLTVEPGAKCRLEDPGPSGWITVQGRGCLGKLAIQSPSEIRFGEHTTDEVFITQSAADAGIDVENTGSEPLVGLRHFGPDAHRNFPEVGDQVA